MQEGTRVKALAQAETSNLTCFLMHAHTWKYSHLRTRFNPHVSRIKDAVHTFHQVAAIKNPLGINNEQIYILILRRVLNALKAMTLISLFQTNKWLQAQVCLLEMLFYALFMCIVRYYQTPQSPPPPIFCLFSSPLSAGVSVYQCVCVCFPAAVFMCSV